MISVILLLRVSFLYIFHSLCKPDIRLSLRQGQGNAYNTQHMAYLHSHFHALQWLLIVIVLHVALTRSTKVIPPTHPVRNTGNTRPEMARFRIQWHFFAHEASVITSVSFIQHAFIHSFIHSFICCIDLLMSGKNMQRALPTQIHTGIADFDLNV